MKKKTITNGLEKATEFIAQLTALHFDLLGYPTIKMHSNFVDVSFTTRNTIRSLDLLKFACDEFRMFADNSDIVLVYTFNDDED